MPDYTYLMVGGGMTADAAAQALHKADPAGSIGLISAEPHPPYDRPPLSKALWKGEPEEKIWRKTAATSPPSCGCSSATSRCSSRRRDSARAYSPRTWRRSS